MFNNSSAECFCNVNKALLQQVTEVNQKRSAEAALAHASNYFVQVHCNGRVARGVNHHVSSGVDVKETLAPVSNRIEGCRFLDTPSNFGSRARWARAGCGNGGRGFGECVCHRWRSARPDHRRQGGNHRTNDRKEKRNHREFFVAAPTAQSCPWMNQDATAGPATATPRRQPVVRLFRRANYG